MKILLKSIISLSLLFYLSGCDSNEIIRDRRKSDSNFKETDSVNFGKLKPDNDTTLNSRIDHEDSWTYDIDSSDRMDNSKVYTATVIADEEIELSSPYNGGAKCSIVVRKGFKKAGNEVIIEISKGQFMPSLGDEASIRAKFDDGKPVSYNYSEAADGSSNYIFLSSANSFITKLKKSSHVIIEAQFFNDGIKQIDFTTKGLTWNH